jgi:DNA gyrase subunit A
MVKELIDYLNSILGDSVKMLSVIKDEIEKLKEKFQDPRRTRVYKSKVDEFSDEDLIQNEPTVITITQSGYIKRQSITSFKTQHRGGKGVSGMTTKEDDAIEHILYSETHDFVLFYTNTGKVYQTRVFEIPESSRVAKGQAIVNLIDMPSGETIKSILTYNPKEKAANKFVLMATKKGEIKKTGIDEFKNIRKSGILAINIQPNDELSFVDFTNGDNDILLVTKSGKIISFNESQIRATGRSSMGVRGIKLVGSDMVVAADVLEKNSNKNLLVITENGIGKKTHVSEFRNQNRGGQGIRVANITEKTGAIVFSTVISDTAKEVIITSLKGVIVKLDLTSIPLLSRNAQGVILMRFKNASDKVATATAVEAE